MSHSTTSKRKTLKSKSTRNNNSSKGPATDVPPHKNIPSHLKYPNYRKVDEATVLAMAEGTHSKSDLGKTKPSLMLKDLRATRDPAEDGELVRPAPPEILEFLNIEDYSAQKQCTVPLEYPLFQPYPADLVFRNFEPFGTYHQRLYFRNNDSFARRVRILSPDSPFFTVRPVFDDPSLAVPKNGKVAAGMEVCYIVTFRPREKRDYNYSLICVTEREKFAVPVRAIGTRACLDFPDNVEMGMAPVKHTATKTFLVRNVGEKATKFALSASQPFDVEPRNGFVAQGASIQVTVMFTPDVARSYEGEMTLEYENGQVAVVGLTGDAQNINVHLGSQIVEIDPAYISLSSQKTVKVYNRSGVPVQFSWKAFGATEEEQHERNRLHNELNRMEEMERRHLDSQHFEDEDGDEDDYSEDEGNNMPAAKRREIAALSRKYKHLRRAVQEDSLLFADENFSIEPIQGEVWANSELEFTITFSPEQAADYACVAFLSTTGREQCLPLKIQATGIGPQASFTYDVLDIGDVFVNSVHTYELVMENSGEIDAEYDLQPSDTPFGPKFKFSPESGKLAVGEAHKIEVSFCSEILGEFSEHFHYSLKGSQIPLSVHFKGHVVGPTFHFNVEDIDFGIVSYEFVNNRSLTLYNTSEIPMTYTLRVPQDGKFLQKEFDINPSSGTIVPDGKVDIQVDFISTTVRVYEMYLTVDVENVGEGLLSIPIKAECRLPDVTLGSEEIEYGSCFLRYPYVKTLELINDSDQKARYEFLPQEEHTMILGTYETEETKGTIDARSRVEVPITLTCEKLGKVNLPMFVKISGQERPPMNIALNANATGPNVILDQNDGINWGPTTCLIPSTRELKVTNDSLIPAPFRTFMKTQGSVFSVDLNEGMLAPGESVVLKITAKLDDTIVHKDQLQIIVHEGGNIIVPLVAKGEGTTLSCDDDISFIEYDYQFTSVTCEKRFFIKNLGRRAQDITWVNKTVKENDEKAQTEFIHAMREFKEKGDDKKKKKKRKAPVEPSPSTAVFTVEPETVTLKPNTGCEFSFYGNTPLTDNFLEELICEIKQGKEKNGRPMLSCKCHGIFINPVLEPSVKELSYVYTWRDGMPLTQQMQPITLRNVAELPLDFVLRTQLPFSIDTYEFKLMPNETTTVNVSFDPGYRDDRVSHVAESALTAVYRDHPKRDSIPLIGEINFPNLQFDYTTVDFGTVLNDTTQTVSVKVTNISKIDTDLSWTFEADEEAARKKATAARPYIPVNQVYDVLPIRSLLRPGETEVVEFAFYGHANRKFRTTAVGIVQGGPEYPVVLQGEASTIAHRMDQSYLDFGKVPYDVEDEVKEFNIINPGRVPFDYRLRLDELSRPDIIVAQPTSGRVYAGDKQKITIKFMPGVPDRIMEQVKVDIAHFEPILFPIYGHGIFTNVFVQLPREDADDEVWLATLEEARRAIEGAKNGETMENQPPLPPAIVPPSQDGSRPDTKQSTLTTGRKMIAQRGKDAGVENSGESGPPKTAPAMLAIPITSRKASVETVDEDQLPPAEKDEAIAIQNEANRIVFMRYLLKQLENNARAFDMENDGYEDDDGDDPFSDTKSKTSKTSKSNVQVPKLPIAVVEAPSKNAMSKAKPIETEDGGLLTVRSQFTPDFVLAKYVCDFGHVVAGTVRKKKFVVSNTGYLPVTFTIDSGGASSKGFHMDPEKVKNVPEGEDINFKVTFKSKRSRLGPIQVEVPIFLKDGPAIVLILKANVTIPDVSVTPEQGIDFGTVLLGRTKIINFQLKNLAPVPTTWSRAKQTKNAQDENYFICTPDVGTLAPGEAQNIQIHFTPTGNRSYDFKLPVKIVSNPRVKTIDLKGQGKELSIMFTPSRVSQVPVLPFADPTSVIVNAINENDYDVEFYSLDFDSQYREEEKVLREIDEAIWTGHIHGDSVVKGLSNYNSTMVVKPRNVGGGLPEKVLESKARKERKQLRREKRAAREAKRKAREEAIKKAEEEGTDPPAEEEDAGEEENLDSTDDEQGEVGELEVEEIPPTKREEGLALDVVFHGAPFTSSEDIARKYANEMGFFPLNLDEVVQEAIDNNTLGGRAAKEKLGYSPEGEKPDEIEDYTLSNELLIAILRDRVNSRECGDGVVIVSLQSKYANEVEIAKAVKDALSTEAVVPALEEEGGGEKAEDAVEEPVEVPLLEQAVKDASKLKVKSGDLRLINFTSTSEDEFAEYINNRRLALIEASKEPEVVEEEGADTTEAEGEKEEKNDEEVPAEFDKDPFEEMSEEDIMKMSDEERADYEKEKKKNDDMKAKEAREFASNLLIKLESTLKSVGEDLQKTDEEVAEMDEDAQAEYCKTRGKALYGSATQNVDEIKVTFGFVAEVETTEGEFVELSEEEVEALSEEEKTAYLAKKEALNAETAGEEKDEDDEDEEDEGEEKEEVENSEEKVEAKEGDAEETTEEATEEEEAKVEEKVEFVLNVLVGGESTEDSLYDDFSNVIPSPPEPPEFVLPIPDPIENQILIKPHERKQRRKINSFKIVTISKPFKIGETDTFKELSEEDIANLEDDAKANYEAEVQERQALKSASRWILPAKSQMSLAIEFASKQTGKSNSILDFEIVGNTRTFSVSADGVCAVPAINKQPMVVFTRRARGRPPIEKVHKRYVDGRSAYEFGPLLINKPRSLIDDIKAEFEGMDADAEEKVKVAQTMAMFDKLSKLDNADTLNISNSGVFDTRVDFTFKVGDNEAPSPFVVWPPFIELPQGETKQVSIWAFPETAELHEDTLVCSIQDNPAVETFPIACLGATPMIEIHGPWEKMQKEAKEEGEEGEDAPSGPIIDFDRLLLKRREAKDFSIKNTSSIPVAWRLKLSDNLMNRSEFEVGPREGVLAPEGVEYVTINFEAVEPFKFDAENIIIEYSDTEGGLPTVEEQEGGAEGRIESTNIDVRAEAYDIKFVIPEFGKTAPSKPGKKVEEPVEPVSDEEMAELEGGVLNFGALRVFEQAEKTFTLRNAGDYQIRFEFEIRRRSSAKLFSITPENGVLDSEGEVQITLTFNSEAEVNLKNNKDIRCSIYEPKTDEFFESFDLTTTVRSLFSTFRLQPLRGVNFSAVKFGQTVTRMIELRNDGEFDFVFRIVDVKADDVKIADENKEAQEKGEEAVTELKKAREDEQKLWLSNLLNPDDVLNDAPLKTGPFTIEPANGVVHPGSTARVTLNFDAEGNQLYRTPLRFDISGRASTNASGRSFEVVGESCIPGIDTKTFESIFEEQSVVPRLEFNEVEMDDPDYLDGPKRIAMFAEENKIFSFGAVVPSQAPKLGVAERFKISNHNKIKCVVNFELSMQGVDEGKTADDGAAFKVQPSSIELPPHEHRYITVYFKPTEMRSYTAAFEANVEDGTEPQTKQLRFDLTGEGTLPCVTVENPTSVDADGALLIDYSRARAGKSKSQTIVLRNAGTVPATLYFDMELNKAFSFPSRGHSITLPPRATETHTVIFSPPNAQEEPFEGMIKMTVMQNEYESTRIRLRGVGYLEDLSIEGLPGGSSDEIDFGQLDVLPNANGKQVSFSLQNDQAEVQRYEFPEHDDFKFVPSVGHIYPGQRAEIIAEFLPAAVRALSADMGEEGGEEAEETPFEAIKHSKVPIQIQVTKIEHKGKKVGEKDEEAVAAMSEEEKAAYEAAMEKAPMETVPVWDNSQRSVVYNDEGEKSEEIAPEPEHEVLGDAKEIVLNVTGCADVVRYECATNQIVFRPTMMFQTRGYKFTVNNTGGNTISYDWALKNKNIKGSTLQLGKADLDKGPASIDCPFKFTPQRGNIQAGASETFVVRFAPMEVPVTMGGVFNYEARASIENLPFGTNDLMLDIRGAAQRPVCHFELPGSDYLERRPADMPGPSGNIGPLDPSIKVIFFESLGTNIKNTLRFKVINPTNMGYDFMWEAIGNPHPAFNNAIKSGTVLPGRRHEQIFEYTPSKNDISGFQESFFRFMIPKQGVDQLFLIAGTVVDPRVTLDRTFVNFGSILLGNPGTEIVNFINREDLPFAFNFDRNVLRPRGGKTVMSIEPMSGVVPANSKLPLKIVFDPADEKPENLSVSCLVRRKPTKLSLNLKGEGAGVHDTLTLFDDSSEGDDNGLPQGVELAPTGVNYVDFGQVHINDTVYKRVVIHNSGKFNLDFRWKKPKNPQVKIEPLQGMVRIGDRLEVKISYHPINEQPLGGIKCSCDVAGTHKYNLSINGRGAKPMLDFSFIEHNFGPCFVPERGGAPMAETTMLRLTNNEFENDVAFDCLFEKTPHLEVKTQPTMLRPNESIDIPIIFTAREVKQYNEIIKFELNGLYTVNVIIKGEGCLLKVELANPTQSLVALGSLRVGQEATRKVLLVNKSKRAALFTLEDVVEAGHGRLEERAVTFFPRGEVLIGARSKTNIEIRFNPLKRLSPFKEDLNLSVVGSKRKLLTITGSCQGIEVTLESDAVPFGSICEGCRISKKLQMENSGDLGTKFKWDNSSFGPDFSISPAEGFLAPHSGVVFEVMFHPTRVFDDFRRDRLMCMVDGAPPLFLTLSGACERQPSDNIKEMEFNARVREVEKQSITINNPTNSTWVIKPAITNNYWSGDTHLRIEAKSSGDYEIAYKPLTMTLPQTKTETNEEGEEVTSEPFTVRHEGSVFFPLPDGTALLYNLLGTADEPAEQDNFEKTAAAKEKMIFEFPVKNWLKKAQRFRVEWDDDNDRFRGGQTLDVPANGLRTYKLSFFGLKEGESFETKVTFTNPESGEYVFYNIKANVTAPIIMGKVKMNAPVRQTMQHVLSIENPLSMDKEVTFEEGTWWTCEDPCVRVRRLGEMTGNPECNFEVEFRPLVAISEPKEVRLTIQSVELGDYHYTLILTSEAAASERALQFKASLGSSHVQTFRFKNMVQEPTEYKCICGNPDAFEMEEKIMAPAAEDWEGTDVEVSISFEPIALGEVRDTLRIVSDVGGEFVCSLYGNGVAPRPQGPFMIAPGETTSIEFKNVFNDAREFSFVVDNPLFSVNVASQKLDANKPITLTVKFEGPSEENKDEAVSGKLYVSCPELKELPPWVYYLSSKST